MIKLLLINRKTLSSLIFYLLQIIRT